MSGKDAENNQLRADYHLLSQMLAQAIQERDESDFVCSIAFEFGGPAAKAVREGRAARTLWRGPTFGNA